MKHHERGIGGTPSRSLTEQIRRVKAMGMEPEPGDLSAIEAVQRIIELHNAQPGSKGGYLLYDPFHPLVGLPSRSPRVGYVSVAAGHEIPRSKPLIVEYMLAEVSTARAQQSDPGSGRVF